MNVKKLFGAALVAAGLFSTQAHAGLIGTTVTYEYMFPEANSVYAGESLASQTAVVGNGIEFFTNYFSIDVTDTGIVYALSNTGWNNGVAHNGPRLTFVGSPIQSASLDVAATSFGGQDLIFNWTSSYVDLNWKNYSGSAIAVNVDTESNDVPEPASLGLLAAGFAAASFARRRARG